MDLKPNAHVACTDGSVGRLEDIILNPHTQRVTYLVVAGNDARHTQKLVPEGLVKEAAGDTITLSIARAKFGGLKNYIQEAYIPSSVMLYLADTAGWNLGRPAGVIMEHPAVPAGGLAVHKGACVSATDGHVGQVDEFLVEGKTGRITHLIMKEGHLWGKKDVVVPVNQIERYADGNVYLKLDKAGVEMLPFIDLKGRGR